MWIMCITRWIISTFCGKDVDNLWISEWNNEIYVPISQASQGGILKWKMMKNAGTVSWL